MSLSADFSVLRKIERPGLFTKVELSGLKHLVKITKGWLNDTEYSLEIEIEYMGSLSTPKLLIFNGIASWKFDGVNIFLEDTEELLNVINKTAQIGKFFLKEENLKNYI